MSFANRKRKEGESRENTSHCFVHGCERVDWSYSLLLCTLNAQITTYIRSLRHRIWYWYWRLLFFAIRSISTFFGFCFCIIATFTICVVIIKIWVCGAKFSLATSSISYSWNGIVWACARLYTRNSRRNRTTIKPRNGTISENPIRNNSTPVAKRERKRDTGSAGADLKIMAIVYRSVALSHLLTGFISLTPSSCIHKLFHIVLADGYNNQISLNTKTRLIWIQIELMEWKKNGGHDYLAE